MVSALIEKFASPIGWSTGNSGIAQVVVAATDGANLTLARSLEEPEESIVGFVRDARAVITRALRFFGAVHVNGKALGDG